MENEIKYIRASSISCYMECGSKYYFQNVERIDTYNKLALAFGTSIHKALQENFTQKIETREDLPIEAVKDIFSSVVDSEFTAVDPLDFTEEKPGQVKDAGIELIEKYQNEVAYRIFPKAVEQKIQVKFKNFDLGLSGTVDLLDEDNVLVDHKTTGKDFKQIPESYRIQVGGAYALLIKALSQSNNAIQPVKAARIDFLIRKSAKSSGTQIKHIPVPIDEQYFLSVFSQVSKGISQGIFLPNRSHMYCSKRFCKFAAICEQKHGGKVRE